MTEIYLHFIFSHYGLYANAPVVRFLVLQAFVGTSDSQNSNFRKNLERQSVSLMREMETLRRRRGIKSGNTQGADNAFSGGASSPTATRQTALNCDVDALLQEQETGTEDVKADEDGRRQDSIRVRFQIIRNARI